MYNAAVSSSGNAVAPKDITTGELADGCTFIGEALEGMLVRVTDVEVVAETTEVQATTPASPDLEATESGPKVMVGVLRDITSEDPNFQRQWDY